MFEFTDGSITWQMQGSQRISVRSKVTNKRLGGNQAPRAKNAAAWLAEHPDYEPAPPNSTKAVDPRRRAAALKAAKTKAERKRQREMDYNNKSIVEHEILLEGYQLGPAGVYITELQGLHKYAIAAYNEERFQDSVPLLKNCLELAEKTLACCEEQHQIFDSFPSIK
eukprot:m.93074 g.93074  ORF g.93074 m.93074 type:complete len:167 (+) comp13380_c0_seq4:630-1130(+)